ncbi:primase-like DNA-binding domain-containing protein [Priestia megaterium]|uniref:primase-like DNA-binding domain-containing protein n=1 Tax=Priestia megaterium TaxID=1404 RepID=UPI003AAC9F6B
MIDKFIKENIERNINNFEIVDDLYNRYLLFCEVNQVKPLTRGKFHNQIKYLGIGATDTRRRKGRENKVCRWGVKLLPCKY